MCVRDIDGGVEQNTHNLGHLCLLSVRVLWFCWMKLFVQLMMDPLDEKIRVMDMMGSLGN